MKPKYSRSWKDLQPKKLEVPYFFLALAIPTLLYLFVR